MSISIRDVQVGKFFVCGDTVREIIKETDNNNVYYYTYLLNTGEAIHKTSSMCSKRQIYRRAIREATFEEIIRMKRQDARKNEEAFYNEMEQRMLQTVSSYYSIKRKDINTYDAFISHATEDKEELVRPLAELLQKSGISIWYDEFQLKVGDSLRRSIDKGLANSQFGIVILSTHFFEKNWTNYELDGLVSKEMEGEKVILPIWHKISKDEVTRYSPTLADRLALNTAMFTIEELANELAKVLRTD